MHGYDQINVCMYQICDKAIWKPFPMEELYQLWQEVKKLNMEEVNSGKERYNDFLPNHLQSEICYLMEENENESWIIKVLLENEKSLIHGPSSNPKKLENESLKMKYLLNLNISLLRNMQSKLI